MKLSRFHRHTTHVHLLPTIFQKFFGIVFLCLLSQALAAQNEEEACIFNTASSISCTGVRTHFGTPPQIGNHFWDFGDGTTSTDPPPFFHEYFDVNPDLSPITAIHTFAGNECSKVVDFPGIFLGTGCGSLRKVSEMVATNKLPTNELVGKKLYVFGNLEVDASYKFDACSIFVSEGGKITVKSGATLTLKNNTIVDAYTENGECDGPWNGIEVLSGGSLNTNVATIRNAYFGISPINPNNMAPLPKLSLQGTVFQRNFVGICATQGRFVVSLFRNNTFEGSGNNPIYQLSTCAAPAQINGVPYAQKTYCGIYFDGSMGGSLLLGVPSFNNLFKDLQAGIVCINGTSSLQGCRFENIAYLFNAPAANQGTAITFIDNLGGKTLRVIGLGKNGVPTINNCERGVYAMTSMPATQVFVSDCRMLEVQNGVELDVSGSGNLSKGTVSNCYIGCTKYLPNIKKRSTGIEVKDPNLAYSNFHINGNEIDVDQPEAYSPANGLDVDILPRGIGITAMHNQASNNEMTLNVGNNAIDLIKGAQGIVLTNVANAIVENNQVYHELSLFDPNAPLVGIFVMGGVGNSLTCNSVYQTNSEGAVFTGLACESSPRMVMSQNNAEDLLGGISFVSDNGTDCVVFYNNLSFSLEIPAFNSTGIFYRNAQTGPQHLEGNDWFGDFQYGSWFLGDAFSYCNSRYHVSPEANVNNAVNPVDQGPIVFCPIAPNNWFTTVESQEDDYSCGGSGGGSSGLYKNEADLNLADGGTLGLSPGYKWSSEMGLYRKFTDNPDLIESDPVISGFLQIQQVLPTAAMYAVQNDIRDLEGSLPASLAVNIQNTLAQLEANEVAMLDLLEDIETDPNVLASYTALSIQTNDLETLLNGYLADVLNSMAQSATAVLSANNTINCSDLPCSSERYINGLYLETQVIAPRGLTVPELESVEEIAQHCPKDAGNIVYMARAWYYFQTGEMLLPDCGSFVPTEGGERNAPPQPIADGDMLLMPNPADGSVQVLLPSNWGESTLTVHDIWGRLLFHREVSEAAENVPHLISIEAFSDGIYLVAFRGNSGKLVVQKLCVKH
ncbi:MAG: T9SS type A sorting domain-containing protein [Saprospiraceae bacterium]